MTDANVLLGRLPHTARLGGSVVLDVDAARAAVISVGDALGLDVEQTALGIVAVADAAMANAIREITVARGIDPRDFSLLAFGGAGPLHAVSIAEELELARVIVPGSPGVLSAWGMVHTDTRHDLVQSFFHRLTGLAAKELAAAVADLAGRSRGQLAADGVLDNDIELIPGADLRYLGQEYTLTVTWALADDAGDVLGRLHEIFDLEHLERFGHNNPAEEVEVVALRMIAKGLNQRPPALELARDHTPVEIGRQDVRFADGSFDTPIYDRTTLAAGTVVPGPAILLESGCTVTVPPRWQSTTSNHGHLVLDRSTTA